jgi:hypothetical protein
VEWRECGTCRRNCGRPAAVANEPNDSSAAQRPWRASSWLRTVREGISARSLSPGACRRRAFRTSDSDGRRSSRRRRRARSEGATGRSRAIGTRRQGLEGWPPRRRSEGTGSREGRRSRARRPRSRDRRSPPDGGRRPSWQSRLEVERSSGASGDRRRPAIVSRSRKARRRRRTVPGAGDPKASASSRRSRYSLPEGRRGSRIDRRTPRPRPRAPSRRRCRCCGS